MLSGLLNLHFPLGQSGLMPTKGNSPGVFVFLGDFFGMLTVVGMWAGFLSPSVSVGSPQVASFLLDAELLAMARFLGENSVTVFWSSQVPISSSSS